MQNVVGSSEDVIVASIAKQMLDIETLEVRNRDCLDFYNCGVGAVRAALKAAYQAGQKSSTNRA